MTITTKKRSGIYEVKAIQGIYSCTSTSSVKSKAFTKATNGCIRLVESNYGN